MKKPIILRSFVVVFAIISTQTIAQKKIYTFPVGVQAYTYRASFPKDVAATLDTIQSLGITELEGGAPKGISPEEFRKMCELRGIKIPATGGGYEQLLKDPVEAAKTAKTLGANPT
ncbi:MAG: hypothetical protein R2822_10845 [Spirosomataceae bacterium]